MRCVKHGHPAPARNTVEARVRLLDPQKVTGSREGATKRLRPVTGETPAAKVPLERVQLDHSPVDVIVVDEISREPIGRPSLTLAIDTFTRCIVGMLLSLEAPSATSVGLCLAHMVYSKQGYLLRLLARTECTIGEIAMFLAMAATEAIRSGEERMSTKVFKNTQYQSPTERRRSFERQLQIG